MRILVNDYAGHPFELQLSRELARLGHTVLHTYFAAYQTPKGRTETGADGQGRLRIVGIESEGSFSQYSAWARRKADAAYGRSLYRHVSAFAPDIVISANTPLDAQRLLLRATQKRGAKFVFWMQDKLSAAVEFVLRKKGVPFAGIVGKLYSRLERKLLEGSDAVICIAPEFRSEVEKWRIDPRKTFVIENWAPLEEIPMLPRETAFREEMGLAGKFCFLYSGTLGMKHKPELLLELARKFSDREEIATVVVAQGAGAEWLREKAEELGPRVLRVLPFQPYERHAEILASGDALIALLDEDCGAFAVPSKLLAYMCAGRPLLAAAPEDNLVSRIVRRAGAGLASKAAGTEFLHAAQQLVSDTAACAAYGENARAYAEKTFRIDRICEQFMDVFAFALGSTTSATEPAEKPADALGAVSRAG